ncbi:MAG: hypothetical protein ACLF0G_14635 [Candidatus Brocadiia bacterium]
MSWKDKKELTDREKSQVRRKAILGSMVAGPLGGIISGVTEKRRIQRGK